MTRLIFLIAFLIPFSAGAMFGVGRGMAPTKKIVTGDPSPPALPYTTNLVVHFDMAYSPYTDTGLTTRATADGADVRGLKDFSGQNNHATNAGADFPNLKTNAVNSLPSLLFVLGEKISFGSAFDFNVVTVFIVIKNTNASGSVSIGSTASTSHYMYHSSGVGFRFTVASNQYADSAAGIADSTWYLGAGRTDGSVVTSFLNGAVGTGNTTPGNWQPDNIGQYFTSGANDMVGEIAEIIIYNEALNGTNRQAIESFLNTKYSLGF